MDTLPISGIITGTMVALVSIYLTYLYNFYYSYGAMINEIEENWFRISELFFYSNLYCRVIYDQGDGNHWLPKNVSLKAANLLPRQITVDSKTSDLRVRIRSYLYQFLPDNAFMILLNKGFAFKIQNLEHVTLFYNHCNKFNYKSQQLEERIREKIDNGDDAFFEIAEIILWYNYYKPEIEKEYSNVKFLIESHKTLIKFSWGVIIIELYLIIVFAYIFLH
jgi:hypothetical protein